MFNLNIQLRIEYFENCCYSEVPLDPKEGDTEGQDLKIGEGVDTGGTAAEVKVREEGAEVTVEANTVKKEKIVVEIDTAGVGVKVDTAAEIGITIEKGSALTGMTAVDLEVPINHHKGIITIKVHRSTGKAGRHSRSR